jgi:hypothetical protein
VVLGIEIDQGKVASIKDSQNFGMIIKKSGVLQLEMSSKKSLVWKISFIPMMLYTIN